MMPLAFVEAAPALIVLLLDALIWCLFGQFVILPWLDEQFGHGNPWWKRVALWPVNVVKRRASKLLHRITSEFSHRFAMAAPQGARLLRRQAAHLEQLTGVVVASNQATYNAFHYIRRTLVPTLIERAVAPLRTQLTNLRTRVDGIEDRERRVSNAIASTLRKLPWGVGGDYVPNFAQWLSSYAHLWNQYFNVTRPQLATLFAVTLPKLQQQVANIYDDLYRTGRNSLDGIRKRLHDLEVGVAKVLTDPTTWVLTALGLAAVPALTATGMRTALRNLTCRNTQAVARELCAMDQTMLAELLAGTLLFSLLLDPREVARVGTDVEQIIGGAWRTMADV